MKHDDVHDQSSFARYVAHLMAEIEDPKLSQEWENDDLHALLVAMEAWASDLDQPANPNPWRHAADVLAAAKIYQ